MSNPVIQTESGKLQGSERTSTSGKKFYSFKGIPYAEPPVGELRFRAPVQIKPWEGVKDAANEGMKSPQLNTLNDLEIIGDEDCLFLNIYIPHLPNNSNGSQQSHPTLVFIHGGGFRMGSGSEDEFGPEFLIEQDTILVTMNYRLGVFGFLCLDTPDVPGNAGLKDQQLALTWIKDNIKHFGGDDKNITIFGVSAGGASVEYHLLNPKSENLFTKALAQSGSVLCPWALDRKPELIVEKMKQNLNIDEKDPQKVMKLLQNLNVKDLLMAAYKATDLDVKKRGILFGLGPVIEKEFGNVDGFLTADPHELLKAGKFLKVPIISSMCRDEGGLFPYFYGAHVEKMMNRQYVDYMTQLNVNGSPESDTNQQLTTLYSSSSVNDKNQLHNFLSDLMFIAPIYRSLSLRSKFTDTNFCYVFSYIGTLRVDLSAFGIDSSKDTQHGADIPYLAKLKDLYPLESKISHQDIQVRKWMVELLANFSKQREPTSSLPVHWIPITENTIKVLNVSTQLELIDFPWEDRMALWMKFYE